MSPGLLIIEPLVTIQIEEVELFSVGKLRVTQEINMSRLLQREDPMSDDLSDVNLAPWRELTHCPTETTLPIEFTLYTSSFWIRAPFFVTSGSSEHTRTFLLRTISAPAKFTNALSVDTSDIEVQPAKSTSVTTVRTQAMPEDRK